MNLIAAQPDLFGDAGLAGLSQAGAFVTPDEEQMLVTSIDAAELSPFRFHGWLGKRLTASYGWSYGFDDASFAAQHLFERRRERHLAEEGRIGLSSRFN
jgi:hypothetical protein